MNADLENRILELLLKTPSRALPLRDVHRVLATEFGVRAGTLAQFRERLRDGSGELLMVEPENPFGDGAGWPPGLHHEYEVALREAGVDLGPWVTATAHDPPTEPGLARALVRASLLELWRTCNGDAGLRTVLGRALADMQEDGPEVAPARTPEEPGPEGEAAA